MLQDMILSRKAPRLYGFSPPKTTNSPERNREIAAGQAQQINALGADGVIVYDVQDEPGRIGTPRPFPFLPALDPLEYTRDYLAAIKAPKILCKSVAGMTEAEFTRWLAQFVPGEDLVVFVGASTSRGTTSLFGLKEANLLARAKGVPAGMNVESVSIRREEIDASCRLFHKLAQGPFAR